MRLDRSGNAKRNIAFGAANKVAFIVLPFITRTVMKQAIGVGYLGLNGLFSSILSVLSLAEMGFSSAIVYNMYRPVAEGDGAAIGALLNYYRRIYRRVGLAILLAGLALLPFLPRLVRGEVPGDVSLYALYLVYLGNTAISYFLFGYLSALLAAHQRNDVTSRISLLTTAMLNAAQVVALLTARNYYVYVLLIPLFTVLNNLCAAVAARRMYPNIHCEGDISPQTRRDIGVKVRGLMVYKLCGTSRNAFDSIVISAMLGLTATAMYNNYFYVMSAAVSMMSVLYNSIMGGIGNSVVTESREKNYADMNKFNFLYMWVAGWCAACLLCLMQPMMRIWMGEALMFPMPAVVLFCLYFYILKMGDIRFVYVEVNGLWWEHRYRAVVESLGNLVLNVALGKLLGVYGVILATILTLFVINFCYGSRILFRHYFTEQSPRPYYLQHFLYMGVTAAVCAVTYGTCSLIRAGGWTALLLRGAMCCALPNLLYLAVYSRYAPGREALGWMKSVVFRGRR